MNALFNNLNLLALTAENGLAAAMSILVCAAAAIGMGFAIVKAITTIGKYPESSVKVRKILLLGLAMIESMAIFGFLAFIFILYG